MKAFGVLALACALAACAKAERPASKSDVEAHVPAAASEPEALPPEHADPQALGELLGAVPKTHPAPTDPHGTLVGTETSASARPATSAAPRASAEPKVESGRVSLQPLLSSPALERAAREQIYWQLGRACRMQNGDLPPAESITLHFELRADGTVLPGRVRADPVNKSYEAVAECVERVFSASGFRGPAEGRGQSNEVLVTWPSVD